ncbi:MAG: hypothetical protein KC478_12705 [Bacteriovoracaceae bacterium]|nr:hypothetical protein [Bacteriovoracaceae bacterium]
MNEEVEGKYNSYPPEVKTKILVLRKMILELAQGDDEVDFAGESLKWGQPSFLPKSSGSTIRLDWKERNPNQISIFVNCQTKLISIFKELYPEDFEYIGNREIRLPLTKRYSIKKLSKCIELALKYNLIKDQF